ncbi:MULTISPECIES: glycosyltransferase [Auritidibacter]|uniref:glycosyltransferase n=1 Tax=Auritidibacter TaxID=1160973 RepID=UPI000D73B853|nr:MULTISPECIES: glycosyltransferase [Auritidibacter]AXR73843.1 glycosyltransferase family 4 protein [Auritidibacter sp. NML130574]NIH72201.1 glycosyltransferase involved in cell wall biosynthesis [Auritidibacter ignavus]PXA77192.1 glycosyltransferase family 4 protein [Auritidibacter sp. NML100628]PXA78908.1 glycosyltransferase family 4 protein [Auritidibacter sp. NML120636]RMX23780.1 glycosyltransferase family 4 protein [Auritidibacter ignavus]
MPVPESGPLTLLIAADTYPPDVNGAATVCFRLATELHRRGHHVHVVSARNEAGPDTVQYRDEATVHRLKSCPAPTHETYRLVSRSHAGQAIGALLDEIKPDVVHAQCHYMIGEAAILQAEKRRIRTVCTNHFMPENLDPFLPFPQWFRNIVSKNSWRDMGRLMGKAVAVTTPTPLSAQTMRERAGLDLVLPVSNGINAAKYQLAEGEEIPKNPYPTVLFVGRLAVEKNIDVLLRALSHTGPEIHAEIVGDGEQRYRLWDLAESLGVDDRVRFLGHLSDEELRVAYLRADAFCQPGTAELQSLVSLEAMSAQKPVILANALALPHLVNEGENGYLFTPGDAGDLADKLQRVLLAAPAERQKMGERSYQIALRHSESASVDVLEALYRGATLEEATQLLPEATLR